MTSDEIVTQGQLLTQQELSRHLPPRTPAWVTSGLLSITGFTELNKAYARLGKAGSSCANLFEEALEELNVRVQASETELAHVPESGPVIVISNHPFGGVDGLALGATMLSRRTDVRIMTNEVLSRITKLAPWFLDVDVFNADKNVVSNSRQVRAAIRHLLQGGLLIVFPAGAVSQFDLDAGEVTDPSWNTGAAVLARRTLATIVPCCFEGANSPLFQAAGMLHPNLSTILLPRELLARRGSRVTLRIGRAVQPSSYAQLPDDAALTAWLRLRVHDLRCQRQSERPRRLQPLARAGDPILVHQELSQLPNAQELVSHGHYRVYCMKASDARETIQEISRLRELTFRLVGEGTGAPRDLDEFDETYQHLVLYDQSHRCIVGAYRFAYCDELIGREGIGGLYTSSLFRYKKRVVRELSDALELGRSFIRPEYQRKPLALALLWRGIGEVLVRNPRYRRLLGPVSISSRYQGSSRRLMLAYLDQFQASRQLRALVDPLRPVRVTPSDIEQRVLSASVSSARQFSRLIEGIDGARGIPVLLQRYLELGAQVLSLSSDPAFGDCTDALVIVDMDRAPATLLKRFMGDAGYERYSNAPRLLRISS